LGSQLRDSSGLSPDSSAEKALQSYHFFPKAPNKQGSFYCLTEEKLFSNYRAIFL
jgi:hypothetical protein